MNEQYALITTGKDPIQPNSIENLLFSIRPAWQGRNLINRVAKLIPTDLSSACQRLFNAAVQDLKEKIVVVGVDLAKEVAANYNLPHVKTDEDILHNYSVTNIINLAYRIGLLSRSEWRMIHRCYDIRRDLEHEDNEYEAQLQDCFYIFTSTIEIILSKDPIELLKVVDVKQLIEQSNRVTLTEEFLQTFKSAPELRQREITELLVSYAYDDNKPDVVRENSVEVMRHIRPITNSAVTIAIAENLEKRLGKNPLDLKTAKIGYACGAIGYFKKVKMKDYFLRLSASIAQTGDWNEEGRLCAMLEDIGGLKFCPVEIYLDVLKPLVKTYIGVPSYGYWRDVRAVYFSDEAAPIVARIVKDDIKRAAPKIEELREALDEHLGNKYVLRRFEYLLDLNT